MSASFRFRCSLLLALTLFAGSAGAEKRAIRVDNASNWPPSDFGTAACPGTSSGIILLVAFGYTFSGRANTATEHYAVNDYCEVAVPGTLNKNEYFHSDENGLRELFGTGNGISAIRYNMLDNSAIFSADGFQWALYTFPSGVTLATLYGLDGSVNGIVPDGTSYIKKGSTVVWNGSNGYNGEYFCFQNNAYIGSWDGNASARNNACLQALGVVFINGFE